MQAAKGIATRGYFECNPYINKRLDMRGMAVLRALLSFWHPASASVASYGSYVQSRPSAVDRAACDHVVIVGSPSGSSRNTLQYGLPGAAASAAASAAAAAAVVDISSKVHMDSQQLTRYFSPRRVVRRRRLASTTSYLNPGRGLCRRHGILAVLLVADRSRVADAFGGVAVGVASAIRVGSAGSAASGEGSRRSGGRGEGRREVLRTRSATLAPSTGAGEERVISRETLSPNGNNDERPTINTATLDRTAAWPGTQSVDGLERNPTPTETSLGMGQRVRKKQGDTRRNGSRTNEKVVSFSELNSRTVDPALVRQTVVHYLQNPDQLTSYQFANLGMASSRHCDIHLVTNVCDTARSMGVSTNVRFMTNLVNAASKSRRWVMASQLLQLMRGYGIAPNEVTFTCILSEMSKAKQHHMASEMLLTEGLDTTLCAYNALISGCTSSRGYDRALGYYKDMLRAGVQPDTMTFSSLIATTRDGSDSSVERGFGAIELMKEAGVPPNTYCMNSLMAVSVQARQPNTALEIFKEMERDGIPRDVVSYNTAIAACDKLGDANAAVRLLRQAREADIVPDVFSYNSVISALGHSSLWEEAIEIFEEMHEAGVLPGLMTYNTLIAGCVRAEHPNEALSVFKLMQERNIKRDQYSYAGALHACMHLRDHTLSMTLLDEMEAAGRPANAEGYATVIRTCARCGKKEEAVFVFSESLRLCIAPSKVTFKALLEAFAETKDAERAAWMLDEMRDFEVKIEQGHLLDALAACTDQAHIALRVIRLNEELDLKVASKMYAKALEVCITAGDYESSIVMVDMMGRVGLQPEVEQEKRMLQNCVDPSRLVKRSVSQLGGEGEQASVLQGEGVEGEKEGEEDTPLPQEE